MQTDLFLFFFMNACDSPASCIQSAVWWVCPHWGNSVPLQWWSLWVPSPFAVWWHRTAWRGARPHTPLFWKGTQGLEWKVGEKKKMRRRKEVRGRKEICIHQHSTSRSMAHHTQQNGAFSPFWIAKMEICLTPQVTIVPPQYPYNSLKMTATTTTCTADPFQNRC